MMIPSQALLDSLEKRICLKSGKPLRLGETLLSREQFPAFYSGGKSQSEQLYVTNIFHAIRLNFEGVIERSPDAVEGVRHFISTALGSGIDMAKEEFLHFYLFHFWESVWTGDVAEIRLAERYMELESSDPQTTFAERFLPRLRKENAWVDIVGLLEPMLYLVEIKHGELDDRGVGQVLRYFTTARKVCETANHLCDIRDILPIIIVSGMSLSTFESLPLHFRELSRILFYQIDGSGVKLVDGKRRLRSQARELFYRSG